MSDQNPQEKIAEQIRSIQTDFDSLQGKLLLNDARQRIESINGSIANLKPRLANIRTKGYPFEKGLEPSFDNLAARWAPQYQQIINQVNIQSGQLSAAAGPLGSQINQLSVYLSNPGYASSLISQTQASLSSFQSRVEAAENSLQSSYGPFQTELAGLNDHLEQLEWTQTQLAEACFQLLAAEGVILAVKAVWEHQGRSTGDDPHGVLYLTDQRLIFEQKQELATKKVLFIATEKKKVQQLQLETAVALVQNVNASKRGFLGHEDYLELTFNPGAPVQNAQFHLDGQDCHTWQALVGRAHSKEFDQDRASALDQAVVERVKTAPTQCPACGGAITQPVLRGMDSITCPYCAQVIRL